jgi:hypothetical protein
MNVDILCNVDNYTAKLHPLSELRLQHFMAHAISTHHKCFSVINAATTWGVGTATQGESMGNIFPGDI